MNQRYTEIKILARTEGEKKKEYEYIIIRFNSIPVSIILSKQMQDR